MNTLINIFKKFHKNKPELNLTKQKQLVNEYIVNETKNYIYKFN